MSNLVKRPDEQNKIALQSSKDLALQKLAIMLDATAKVMGYELGSGEVRMWQAVFGEERTEAIEVGFVRALKASKFFPKPAEVREQIELWREQLHAEHLENANQLRIDETEQARKEGKLCDFPALIRRLMKIAEGAPIMQHMEGKSDPYECKLSDAELADRREMLRQQAERLLGSAK